jgi:hypothetical protein
MMQAIPVSLRLLAALCCAIVTAATVAAPATLTQPVSSDGETITLRLTLQQLRGLQFELWVQNAAGGYDAITPVAERAYLGTVDEYPGAVASGILQDDGQFRGAVYFERGATWLTLGGAVTSALGMTPPSKFGLPSFTVEAGHAGTTTYGFDVGVDADHDYLTARAGGSIARAFEMIEYSVAITRAAAAQDPYNTDNGSKLTLTAIRDEWNANHADADRDVVAGSGRTQRLEPDPRLGSGWWR